MTHTILVVDDHPSFRASACWLLQDSGFRVVGEAADGATALVQCRRLQPQIVLLDVYLPDIDGFAVCQQITATAPHPIVILTSSREETELGSSRVQASGAQGFLPKLELSGDRIRQLLRSR